MYSIGGLPRTFFAIAFLAWSSTIYADHFVGTGSCSSSNCHGSAAPRKESNVLSNEYVTWQKHDRHSRAWTALTENDAQKIAKNMGIGKPEEEPLCLRCHATYVDDSSLRGERYSLQDGVSCESCHGAAERWLDKHAQRGATHAQNVSNGMKEIVPLDARAELCLTCHYGSEKASVTHRLIGAGHPRLSFELDTFSMIQPKHWEYDDDYGKRKGGYDPAHAWLVGQIKVAIATTDALASPKRSRDGVMPELSLYNCFACHHSLTEDQWKVREYDKRPGELKLNLSSIRTVHAALEILDSKMAAKFGEEIQNLHTRYMEGEAVGLLAEMRGRLAMGALPLVQSHRFSAAEVLALLERLVRLAASTPYFQYEDAEQLAMGMSALISTDENLGKRFKNEIDGIYAALKNAEAFRAEEFTKAAKKFQGRF